MLFDRLCMVAERHLTDLRPVVEDAALFEFPGAAHEVLPKQGEWDEDKVAFQRDHFFLPFPVVAVEDPASIVLLFDFEADAQGFAPRRGFIELAPAAPNPDAFGDGFREGTEEAKALAHALRASGVDLSNTYTVNTGWIEIRHMTSEGMLIEGNVYAHYLVDGKTACREVKHTMPPDVAEAASRSTLINAKTALEEIVYFNDPAHFIVESQPAHVSTPKKKKGKARLIQRSETRPRYTIIKPREASKLFNTPVITAEQKRSPHMRRRHFRTLRSDHWTNKQGQTIVVKASWIGPEEATEGKRRYKIRLDL